VTDREPVVMALAAGVTAANPYYTQVKRFLLRQPDLENGISAALLAKRRRKPRRTPA
jgi:hypothetical protein